MDDALFLKRAIDLSAEKMAAGCGGPFGAVIVRDGKVIAEGWNQVTTSLDPTAHAEVTAIRAACRALNAFSLEGCAIYSSCEPCPMCLSAIYWARLDRLVFGATQADAAFAGFDDAFLYHEFTLPKEARQLPTTQQLRSEAKAVLEAWTRLPGRVPY